jgi:hypothetical protein
MTDNAGSGAIMTWAMAASAMPVGITAAVGGDLFSTQD